jgi:hypothetical protein
VCEKLLFLDCQVYRDSFNDTLLIAASKSDLETGKNERAAPACLPAASPAPFARQQVSIAVPSYISRRILDHHSYSPHIAIMTEVGGRRSFKVFGQEFIVDARYNVTKELGQGAYGIVWYVSLSATKS